MAVRTARAFIPTEHEPINRLQLGCRKAVADEHGQYAVVGHSSQAGRIVELARELLALARIQEERPELAGDAVARREVLARRAEVQAQLEHAATWHRRGAEERSYSSAELSALASDLSDDWYPLTPRIHNELLNRMQPSSNAIAAQNALLKAMLLKQGELRLHPLASRPNRLLPSGRVSVAFDRFGYRLFGPRSWRDPTSLA